MNDCCNKIVIEARKELKRKDDRIQHLESEITRLFDPVREFWNIERREQIQAMAEALKFYANRENWQIPEVDSVTGYTGMSAKSDIEKDRGEMAMAVLKDLNLWI